MAKVKKTAAVTSGRNAGRGGAARSKKARTSPVARRGRTAKTKASPVSNTRKTKTAKRSAKRAAAPAPAADVAVRALDPQRKCGPGTSVQRLYRVDESVNGRRTPHLVFFDRHGWYCEHGRACPAVKHAQRHDGQIARGSKGSRTGLTRTGWMREA